ncbi:carboxylating nicotinate-nucleotide diphosphorylase [Luteolibacter flavescens]|uniref:nicotinate-nucleotide diphosphorylase (carboxylating) n=1 Tax=Luteolibacter flavescens TaxID=1859460 RepID=A0ABT3FJA9_9BACT|nr:carboxylating nicotinate-nucleotide diphosphorylase [Luteolibacter flavescens]MCW1883643.1 carboxylating nicotinate-nucleotide diphosphorylase [Luteolibacter flavescens]
MHESVERLIQAALAEDIGPGDLTSRYFVPAERRATGFIVARESGVLSGGDVALEVLRQVDTSIEVTLLVEDGSRISSGAYLIKLEGPARSLLTAERTVLNFLQRMSGVASATRQYVDAVKGTNANILDTRKTIPGWRRLDKLAVTHGGGVNHRMGLYDRVMVKDNHLVAEGRVEELQQAIANLKADHPDVEVELEADNLTQVEAFLGMEYVDHILLDNMSLAELRRAVELRGDKASPKLEASGGVNLETVAGIAETGVDFISVGAITHSARALDLALDFVKRE